jgi:hypothetical protein
MFFFGALGTNGFYIMLNHVAEHGKHDNVERLFMGEAYHPYRFRYKIGFVF